MKYKEHKFPYEWTLKDATFTKDKGTVFSCFACGGGSSFGYKLAGFDVLGFNEIDKRMASAYIENHNPKYQFIEPIQDFKNRKDLPKELYNLDILDGSPPCSSFSITGNREKDWGKNKQFREGQSKQVLDTLFFDFIDLAKELQPKVVVAENVKGLLQGNAKKYVIEIYKQFDAAGYYCQYFLLDASKMGVPQRRERVFFICLRKDLASQFLVSDGLFDVKPFIEMEFCENEIPFKEITKNDNIQQLNTTKTALKYWHLCEKGNSFSSVSGGSFFNWIRFNENKVAPTLHTENGKLYHSDICRPINNYEFTLCSTFPLDYNFKDLKVGYLCGMSVPPTMVAQIATKIYQQWLSKL